MSEKSLLDQINQFKEEYYTKNTKNVIFKNSQKVHCAQEICQKFELNDLLEKTMYFIPNTNHLFFDYMIFKMYANEQNYAFINAHILKQIIQCITLYGTYNVHMDLNTFTVSAGERYMKFVDLFMKTCSDGIKDRGYFISERIQKLYLYNPPSIMDILHKMFTKRIEHIKNNIEIIPKKDSKQALDNLLTFTRAVENRHELCENEK